MNEYLETLHKVKTTGLRNKSKKNLRKMRFDDEDDDKCDIQHLDNIRERQKLRQRSTGMSVLGLALGKKLPPEEELKLKDPFQLMNGGLVNMKTLRSVGLSSGESDYDVDIGTQFSAETNKRDEDEEMMKYIERELEKRKGLEGKSNEEKSGKWMSPEDAALFALPEHLRKSTSQRSEEMLSYQMLNGIPEIDLGIDSKISNIEATEDAKQKLIQDRLNQKDLPSHFVPTNMAVNFIHHNRFGIEEHPRDRRKYGVYNNGNNKTQKKHQSSVVDANEQHKDTSMTQKTDVQAEQTQGKEQPWNRLKKFPQRKFQFGAKGVKRATDDYHYDKFKKQFRRY